MAAAVVPRDWQRAAAERALRENIVVTAETGSGKTLVACLAALEALKKGKVAFIVPVSRLLAHQQFLRLHDFLQSAWEDDATRPRVVEVTGHTASGWGKREWRDAEERFGAYVGTAEIFRQAFVDSAFLRLQDFALLVVDECHHVAGEGGGVAEVLFRLHYEEGRCRPHGFTRVLGLTASLAGAQAKTRQDFEEQRQVLLDAMQANVEPCKGLERREPPSFKKLDFPEEDEAAAMGLAERLCELLWQQTKLQGVQEANERVLEKLVRSLGQVLCELGKEAFLWAVEHGVVEQLKGRIEGLKVHLATQQTGLVLEEDLEKLQKGVEAAMEEIRETISNSGAVSNVSEKAAAAAREPQELGEEASGMFFVDQVALAAPLAYLLQRELGEAVEVASGVQSMQERRRNEAFQRFRSGSSRLLVCTSCAEEGVDVSACAFVVRFSSFSTTRSHVQGAGRARLPRARIYYMENNPEEEIRRAEVMRQVAEDESLPGPSQTLQRRLPLSFRKVPGVHPFVAAETGAEVSLGNASHLLGQYVAVVSKGQGALKEAKDCEKGERPLRVTADVPGGPGLLLPGPGGGCLLADVEVERFWEGHVVEGSKAAKRMCYVAVLLLIKMGWLDAHNRIPRRVKGKACWPVEAAKALRFAVKPGWCPAGLLGGVGGAEGMPQKIDGRSSDRERVSSGAEQVHMERQRLSPLAVRNTQTTVNHTFSNGSGLMEAMLRLVRGEQSPEDFPAMRVSSCPESGEWFSADNRRCFIFKVVAPLLSLDLVEVDVINWTSCGGPVEGSLRIFQLLAKSR